MSDANVYITTKGKLDLQAGGVASLLGVSIDLCTGLPAPPDLNAVIGDFSIPTYTGYGSHTIAIGGGYVDPASQMPYDLSIVPAIAGPSDDSAGVDIPGFVVRWHTAGDSVPIVGLWGKFTAPYPEQRATDVLSFALALGADLSAAVTVNAPVGIA